MNRKHVAQNWVFQISTYQHQIP